VALTRRAGANHPESPTGGPHWGEMAPYSSERACASKGAHEDEEAHAVTPHWGEL